MGGGLCVRMRSAGAVIENWRRVGALFFVTSCRGGRASFLRRAEAIKEKRKVPTISQIIQNYDFRLKNKKKVSCAARESNPGRKNGNLA